MNKAEKTATIEALKEKFENTTYFYLADSSTLSVEKINQFRRICFQAGVEVKVVKNTLVKKAFEGAPANKNYEQLFDALSGPTAILFTEVANQPAKILKDFRKDNDRPLLKAAYIDSAVFLGDDQIDVLTKLKTKEELVGEVLGLLQSPARNVISALSSGGQTIMGLLKTLEERGE